MDKIPPGLQQELSLRQMLLRLSLNAAGGENFTGTAPTSNLEFQGSVFSVCTTMPKCGPYEIPVYTLHVGF